MAQATRRDHMVTQAFRFALDPTPAQARALARHAGAARAAFNWGLARVKANLSQRHAERSYGITEDTLTPALDWSMYAMRKAWNQAKDQVAPWWAECSKEAYATGLDQLARALKNWSDSRNGKRKGPRMGFPRFKAKRKVTPSCRFTTGTIRPATSGSPRITDTRLNGRAGSSKTFFAATLGEPVRFIEQSRDEAPAKFPAVHARAARDRHSRHPRPPARRHRGLGGPQHRGLQVTSTRLALFS